MASGSTASSPSAAGTRRSFGSGSRVGVLLGQPLIRELSTRLNAAGIGSFKFNNRGHDVVTGLGKQFAGVAFQALRAERSPSRIPKPLVPRAWGFRSARRYISLYCRLPRSSAVVTSISTASRRS